MGKKRVAMGGMLIVTFLVVFTGTPSLMAWVDNMSWWQFVILLLAAGGATVIAGEIVCAPEPNGCDICGRTGLVNTYHNEKGLVIRVCCDGDCKSSPVIRAFGYHK